MKVDSYGIRPTPNAPRNDRAVIENGVASTDPRVTIAPESAEPTALEKLRRLVDEKRAMVEASQTETVEFDSHLGQHIDLRV
jgi:hypothetical protein